MKTVYLVNESDKIEKIKYYKEEAIVAMKYAENCFRTLSRLLGDEELEYIADRVNNIKEEIVVGVKII